MRERKGKHWSASVFVGERLGWRGGADRNTEIISIRKERFFSEKIIEWWKRLPQKAESKTTEGVGFPGGSVIKNAGDTGSIPDPGRPHMPRSN